MNYQFTGYTVNGQVRARKSEEDEFIVIESMHDVSNLRWPKRQGISHIKFMFILAFGEWFALQLSVFVHFYSKHNDRKFNIMYLCEEAASDILASYGFYQ